MEGDLAFRGVDLRDLWRSGSGLTLRRLLVLVQALPPDSITHLTLTADNNQSLKPTPDQIRARAAHYAGEADS